MRKIFLYTNILLIIFFVSCKKFIEVDPPRTQLIGASVFDNNATATSAILGIYSTMMQDQYFASINITFYAGLSSDELVNYSNSSRLAEFYNNALTTANTGVSSLWGNAYQYIFAANAVLEGLAGSTKVDETVKQQLLGEAKFIRAFCYLYLINLFSDVPLILTTNYQSNAVSLRAPKEELYRQIISDLTDCQNLLADKYLDKNNSETTERVRPNKWAATALLARIYLYLGDWSNAEIQSTSVINNNTLYDLLTDLNKVFLKNSGEAIWQLMPVRPGFNTWEGSTFILTTAPSGTFGTALSNQIVNAFEAGDSRKANWVKSISIGTNTYYFPYKYKVKANSTVTEYYLVLRLAEQYLIRAEARAKVNNLNGAIKDLNFIRNRAELPDLVTALTQSQVLNAIEQEKRVEFFAEWGHRWLDLKRWGKANAVLGPIKGSNWQPTDQLYPIPQSERANDPNLTQNLGY